MKLNNSIYSIHLQQQSSGLLHIETVVTGGMYNFIILGVSQRYSSDLKNKVYTALRADGLLNLKSDNRKITTNIIADSVDVIPVYAELAVAISCALCILHKQHNHTMLVVGGLSITGTIIPSGRILHTIHIAVKNRIGYIVCATDDIEALHQEYITYAENFNIQFITGRNIKDILDSIQNIITKKHITPTATLLIPTHTNTTDYSDMIKSLREYYLEWSIFIAMCGKHNCMIQTNNIHAVSLVIDTLSHSLPRHSIEERVLRAYESKIEDTLYQNITQKGFYIKNTNTAGQGAHLTKIAAFIYLEDILHNPIHVFKQYSIPTNTYILATCLHCPCGNKGSIYNKCLCLQRNILRYQNNLNTAHKNNYSLWIEHHQNNNYTTPKFDTKTLCTVIQRVQNLRADTCVTFDAKAKPILEKLRNNVSKEHINKLLDISHTLQILSDIEEGGLYIHQTKKPTSISSKNLMLAFSYIPKMDF